MEYFEAKMELVPHTEEPWLGCDRWIIKGWGVIIDLEGAEEPRRSELIQIHEDAYRVCLAMKEGLKRKDVVEQTRIALRCFDRYPFVFAISDMAKWYLKHVLATFSPSYVLLRCTAEKGVKFDYKTKIKGWDVRGAEDIPVFPDYDRSREKTATRIFGKLKKRKKCLVVILPNGEEMMVPVECTFKPETEELLGLTKHHRRIYYHVFQHMGWCHSKEPYYYIAPKGSPFPKVEVETPVV